MASRPTEDVTRILTSSLNGRAFPILVALIALASTACDRAIPLTSSNTPPILLFNGTGTSPNDVAAVEIVLNQKHLPYSTANSTQLNEMSESQLRNYRLLIVPGGNFEIIGNHLTSGTSAHIHNAVKSGLNYLGICAGAFFGGNSVYNGLNLTSGVQFGFYSAENQGIRKAAVAITDAGGQTLDQYWEDGPQLSGWGSVVGKYPDGTPAIVEGMSGSGWVVLSGVHPEAPATWRRGMSFATPVSVDNAYAGTLIDAVLHRVSLAHY
ncbi:MAG TPA: BPL-N domain-containing protein [Bryobacteraceae bacterium]|nr:BPL-N domain-containing protein [Bryobacteraceae bacterium]